MHRDDWAWPAGTVRLWAENEWVDALERQVGFTSSNSGTPPSNGGPRKQPAPCRGTVAMAPAAAPEPRSRTRLRPQPAQPVTAPPEQQRRAQSALLQAPRVGHVCVRQDISCRCRQEPLASIRSDGSVSLAAASARTLRTARDPARFPRPRRRA